MKLTVLSGKMSCLSVRAHLTWLELLLRAMRTSVIERGSTARGRGNEDTFSRLSAKHDHPDVGQSGADPSEIPDLRRSLLGLEILQRARGYPCPVRQVLYGPREEPPRRAALGGRKRQIRFRCHGREDSRFSKGVLALTIILTSCLKCATIR